MANIRQILVTSERLLTKLKAEFPNLYAVGSMSSAGITAAGAGFTLNQVANAARKHDPNGDNHDVHYRD